MAFNFEAGISAAGDAVSKTAGVFMAETLRSELEQQKIVLADTLAGKREELQRQHQSGEADKQRGWQSGEHDKDRTFKGEEGKLDRENRLATTNISAGASIAGARLASETQKEIHRDDREARAKEHDKTLQASIDAATKIQIGDDGTAYSINPITKKVEPFKVDGETLKFRDPDVAKAQVELIKTKSAQLTDLSRTYGPQVQSLETSIRALQTKMIPGDKEALREIGDAQARLRALQERWDGERAPLIHELNEMGRSFATKGKVAVPPGQGGRPPLTDLIKIPGMTAPSVAPGLINTPE